MFKVLNKRLNAQIQMSIFINTFCSQLRLREHQGKGGGKERRAGVFQAWHGHYTHECIAGEVTYARTSRPKLAQTGWALFRNHSLFRSYWQLVAVRGGRITPFWGRGWKVWQVSQAPVDGPTPMHTLAVLIVPDRLFLREERRDVKLGGRRAGGRKQGLGRIMFRFINYKILKRIEKKLSF